MSTGWVGVECDHQGGNVNMVYLPMQRDISGDIASL
jgi:hypothetical protein